MGDFWDNLIKEADFSGGHNGSMDDHLSGKAIGGPEYASLQGITDKGRAANALQLPAKVGTRVSFAANLGAVLTYKDPPMPKSEGVVVTVKSANGEITSHEGMVFVQWDDGQFRSIHAEHLRKAKPVAKTGHQKTNDSNQLRVASLGDLSDFLRLTASGDTLIHRSTRDLWSFRRDGADYVIERLFDSTGGPLKG